jgi:CRISPR/Cas system-associated endoribonuclease Cas2
MALNLHCRQWIVTFDVSLTGDRRRTHLALRRHGLRVMNSVYVLDTDPALISAMTQQLRPSIRDGDHLLAIPQCAACSCYIFGSAAETPPSQVWVTT